MQLELPHLIPPLLQGLRIHLRPPHSLQSLKNLLPRSRSLRICMRCSVLPKLPVPSLHYDHRFLKAWRKRQMLQDSPRSAFAALAVCVFGYQIGELIRRQVHCESRVAPQPIQRLCLFPRLLSPSSRSLSLLHQVQLERLCRRGQAEEVSLANPTEHNIPSLFETQTAQFPFSQNLEWFLGEFPVLATACTFPYTSPLFLFDSNQERRTQLEKIRLGRFSFFYGTSMIIETASPPPRQSVASPL